MSTKKEIDKFYREQTDNSRVKANIVATYFPQYARIINRVNQKKIRFIDLFCGKGRYDDGKFSTPYLITKSCIEDSVLREKVQLHFNDMFYGTECGSLLHTQFDLSKFRHKVQFGDYEVGNHPQITNYLSKQIPKGKKNPHPTLLFYDPFGYKAIDTLTLSKFMQPWGNEIFLFFNTKRISAAVDNDKFTHLMRELFPKNYKTLRNDKRYGANVQDRLQLIIENIEDEFRTSIEGNCFMTPFRFMEEDNVGTSHYILHLTKGIKGYELIKTVYSEYDNIGADLVNGTYTFDSKRMGTSEGILNFGDINAETLANEIFEKYQGKTITSFQLFQEMHPKTLYSGRHFATALRQLNDQKVLQAERTDTKNWRELIVIGKDCKLTLK